jgi:hypothetical protein
VLYATKAWSQWLLFVLLIVRACRFRVLYVYALQDWAILQGAQEHFRRVAARPTTFSALFVAEAQQNTHRINLFADVVWALLGAIIAAIGIHGLCTIGWQESREETSSTRTSLALPENTHAIESGCRTALHHP